MRLSRNYNHVIKNTYTPWKLHWGRPGGPGLHQWHPNSHTCALALLYKLSSSQLPPVTLSLSPESLHYWWSGAGPGPSLVTRAHILQATVWVWESTELRREAVCHSPALPLVGAPRIEGYMYIALGLSSNLSRTQFPTCRARAMSGNPAPTLNNLGPEGQADAPCPVLVSTLGATCQGRAGR